MSMDEDDTLSKDMVEQLLKFVPTATEQELLESHTTEWENFARADKFLLEMSRCVCVCVCVCEPCLYLLTVIG